MDTYRKTPEKRVELSPGGYSRERKGHSKGGWAYVLRYRDHMICRNGSEPSKSERRMELLAAVNGLKQLKEPCQVELHTGSEYISDGVRSVLRRKRSDPFMAAVHQGTAKNADLWKDFEALCEIHQVERRWVPCRSKHMDSDHARSSARNQSY